MVLRLCHLLEILETLNFNYTCLSTGIFLGYSLLELFDYGINWLGRAKMYCEGEWRLLSQTSKYLRSEKGDNDFDSYSCVLDLGNE